MCFSLDLLFEIILVFWVIIEFVLFWCFPLLRLHFLWLVDEIKEKHLYANATEAWKLFFFLNERPSRRHSRGKTRCHYDALVSLLLSVSLFKILRLSIKKKEKKNSLAFQLDRENLRKTVYYFKRFFFITKEFAWKDIVTFHSFL